MLDKVNCNDLSKRSCAKAADIDLLVKMANPAAAATPPALAKARNLNDPVATTLSKPFNSFVARSNPFLSNFVRKLIATY